MQYRLDRGSHSVQAFYHHYVQVVKYRSKVFDNEQIINFLKEQIQGINRTFEDEVIYIGLDKDHLYINAPLNILRARPGLPLEPVDRKDSESKGTFCWITKMYQG